MLSTAKTKNTRLHMTVASSTESLICCIEFRSEGENTLEIGNIS